MRIITGSTGTAHVTANDDGELNQAVFGTGLVVLPNGNKLGATVVTANTIRIADGSVIFQGRQASINPGAYEDMSIQTGSYGKKRIDLICVRYEVDDETGYESISLVVKTGTAASGTPTAPSYAEGDIRTGAALAECPLYRVTINNTSVESVEYACEVYENAQTYSKSLSGAVSLTVKNGMHYVMTGVTSLSLTGDDVDCYGTITFASSVPTISVSGFTASDGDDIAEASASEVWEFNCMDGRILWKNWSAV